MSGENNLFIIGENEKRPQEEIMTKVVSDTFEKMGFMAALPTDEDAPEDHILTAFIDVLDPIKARIHLSAPQNLGWDLAENLYGLEDLTLEAVSDMMTELLNTISGRLMSEIMPDQQFDLSVPTLCDTLPPDNDNTFVYHFKIDNKGIITIVLSDN